jgi:hypothetical protein
MSDLAKYLSLAGALVVGMLFVGMGWVLKDRFLKRVQGLESRAKAARLDRRRQRERRNSSAASLADKIVAIYARRGWSDRLYTPVTVGGPGPIPMLGDGGDAFISTISPTDDAPIEVISSKREELPFDHKLVERKQEAGIKVWDGSVLFVKGNGGMAPEPTPPVQVGVCNYFASMTLGDVVQRECRANADPGRTLASHFSSFDAARLATAPGPISVGADAVCVFEDQPDQVVVIHRRSDEVVNSHGLHTVSPAFGFEPNWIRAERSRFGIVYFNFLKEFLEEFWGDDDVAHTTDRPRAHPDWIFDSEQGSRLLREVDEGRVSMACAGVSIDLTHPSLILALVVRFQSREFLDYVKRAPGCWEGREASIEHPALSFLPLHSSELSNLMNCDTMKATSIFALDRARSYLAAGAQTA